jgi:leader peptidase (prepilin peptidase)/N-methyltransferase
MIAILAFIFIIGLVVGSFLNVVILRTVSGESIVFPGSKCPKCQNPLKWYHNIPVLSYLFLKGKCAFCKEKISIQYPVIELITGLIFTGFGYLYLNTIFNTNESVLILTLMFLVSIIASSLFIVISGTDFKELQVSDIHTYSLIALGLVYSIVIGSLAFYGEFKFGITKWWLLFTPVLYTILAAGVAFIFMEILRRCANFLMKTETFGDGDSYIFCGIAGVVTSVFGASDIKYILVMLLILFFISVILSVIFTFPFYLKSLFNDKNWRLIGIISVFLIYCAGYFYAINSLWLISNASIIISTLILVVLGILLCHEILKGIKDRTQDGTQIPFGPALCASGLMALFVLPILLGIV